ncbi:MAG: NAD(P)H-hydrate dehydratase [Candidatus Acidiferrales bacterium]
MKIVTAAEMREIDRRTAEEHGVPFSQLMENAAERIVQFVQDRHLWRQRQIVTVLCGKGNNGGDGLAFARRWREATSSTPRVFLFADPSALTGDASENYKRLRERDVEVLKVTHGDHLAAVRASIAESSVVVDALLGTGSRGAAEGVMAQAIEDVNRRRGAAVVVAVDIPSGLPSEGTAAGSAIVRADHTVTFTAPKVGSVVDANREYVGELNVAVIGTPPEVIERVSESKWRWLEAQEFRGVPLVRKRDAHKGDFGHVLVAAGSRGKAGAAALVGMGALRAGAGLVTIATPESSQPVVASFAPEYMTEPLAETDAGTISLRSLEYGRFDALLKGKSVLAIGPGLSTQPETQEFVRTVVKQSPVPVVLDADGLNAFAGRADELKQRVTPWLAVTPHPGEMARLRGVTTADVQAQRNQIALEAATRWNAYVILKGYRTVIATPGGELFINPTGTPAMATGGTGDVLTGVLAAATAQFWAVASEVAPEVASALALNREDWGRVLAFGVYVHGLAARMAVDAGVQVVPASDLARAVQQAMGKLASGFCGGSELTQENESSFDFC